LKITILTINKVNNFLCEEERILALAPEVKNRLFLLKEFAKIRDDSLDIPDPMGTSLDFYRQTYAVIKEAVERVVEII